MDMTTISVRDILMNVEVERFKDQHRTKARSLSGINLKAKTDTYQRILSNIFFFILFSNQYDTEKKNNALIVAILEEEVKSGRKRKLKRLIWDL